MPATAPSTGAYGPVEQRLALGPVERDAPVARADRLEAAPDDLAGGAERVEIPGPVAVDARGQDARLERRRDERAALELSDHREQGVAPAPGARHALPVEQQPREGARRRPARRRDAAWPATCVAGRSSTSRSQSSRCVPAGQERALDDASLGQELGERGAHGAGVEPEAARDVRGRERARACARSGRRGRAGRAGAARGTRRASPAGSVRPSASRTSPRPRRRRSGSARRRARRPRGVRRRARGPTPPRDPGGAPRARISSSDRSPTSRSRSWTASACAAGRARRCSERSCSAIASGSRSSRSSASPRSSRRRSKSIASACARRSASGASPS